MIQVTYRNGRRVHREYVAVLARFDEHGSLIPLAVCWKDGRTFWIDEVIGGSPVGVIGHDDRTKFFDVRIGDHETRLYLLHRPGDSRTGKTDEWLWWVNAYDGMHIGGKRAAQAPKLCDDPGAGPLR